MNADLKKEKAVKDAIVVAAVQMDCKLFDVEANLQKMRSSVEKAKREHGAELIVFPELSSIGYIKDRDKEFGLEYINRAQKIPGPFTGALSEIAEEFGVHIISGMTQLHPIIPATIYNTAVLIDSSGKLVGIQQKIHIPGYEKHYFMPGNEIKVFDTALGKIGMSICYDGQFAEYTRTLALKGAEIMVMLWNMPGFSNEPEILQKLTATRAFENRFYAVSCNRIGTNSAVEFFGHSAISDPLGNLIACAGGEDTIIYAELERDVMVRERAQMPIFRDRRPEMYAELMRLD